MKARGSRRHVLAIGAIAASAFFAKISTAKARPKKGGDDGGDDGGGDDGHHCFLRGTLIDTAEGPRKIEDLVIGDRLPTVFGGTRPIQWIGRYRFKRRDLRKAWVKDVCPVRIAASALAPNVPSAALYVTASHKLLIDGVLMAAGDLINGTTITRDEGPEFAELEYFHIKLETHDAIFAEGAACETLLNVDEAAGNFAEYLLRYGAPSAEETLCAPALSFDGAKSMIKSRLRSALSPWVDRRQPADRIRDRLEERGMALRELSSL